MALSSRYFINNLPDYSGGEVVIPKEDIKSLCSEYLRSISSSTFSREDCDGGLYVGVAGIAYAFYYISQHPEFINDKSLKGVHMKYVQQAISYVESKSKRQDKKKQASFFLEAAGVYAMASAVYFTHGDERISAEYLQNYITLADVCEPLSFLSCGSDELFVGRAGYLCGVSFLEKIFGLKIIPEEKVFMLCETIIQSGLNYSQQNNSPCPLMYAYYGTEYLGAAHGLSGILQMLLNFPNYLDMNPHAEQKVRESVDFFLQLQSQSGNFPCDMEEAERPRPPEHELVHWCHGAPGVVYLMIKAYLRWKEEKYWISALACGEITWKKGLLRKGPGICHGVAGSGYVFLALYRLTGDNKHLHRAVQFAKFLATPEFKTARIPDCPVSLFEGIAGTALFLTDLLYPQNAEFPFFNVF